MDAITDLQKVECSGVASYGALGYVPPSPSLDFQQFHF